MNLDFTTTYHQQPKLPELQADPKWQVLLHGASVLGVCLELYIRKVLNHCIFNYENETTPVPRPPNALHISSENCETHT